MTALTAEPLPQPLDALPALRLLPAPVSLPPYDDEPISAPALRLVTEPQAVPVPVADDSAWFAATRTPTAELPSSRAFAHTLLQGVLEVAAGVRAVTQLRRDTTPELYAELAPTVTSTSRRGPRPGRGAVRSVHVQERPEGVVEVCATVLRGERVAALALRLEGLDGRWRCTELVGL